MSTHIYVMTDRYFKSCIRHVCTWDYPTVFNM